MLRSMRIRSSNIRDFQFFAENKTSVQRHIIDTIACTAIHDAVIVLEDDLEVGIKFLDYVLKD